LKKIVKKYRIYYYNEVYNNIPPKLYLEDYSIKNDYIKDNLVYNRDDDVILFDSNAKPRK
jgi:hypothetical protein